MRRRFDPYRGGKLTSIEIVKGFLAEEDCQTYINFIDDNLDKFVLYNGPHYPAKRYTMRFGKDDEYPEQAHLDFSQIEEIRDGLLNIFVQVIEMTKKFYDQEELYLTSFFLSKNIPGSYMNPHHDSAPHPGGGNYQLDYNVMLYLNTLDGNGEIVFPQRQMMVSPDAGDLVFFDTKDMMNSHSVNLVTQDRYSIPIWLTRDKSQEFPGLFG